MLMVDTVVGATYRQVGMIGARTASNHRGPEVMTTMTATMMSGLAGDTGLADGVTMIMMTIKAMIAR